MKIELQGNRLVIELDEAPEVELKGKAIEAKPAKVAKSRAISCAPGVPKVVSLNGKQLKLAPVIEEPNREVIASTGKRIKERKSNYKKTVIKNGLVNREVELFKPDSEDVFHLLWSVNPSQQVVWVGTYDYYPFRHTYSIQGFKSRVISEGKSSGLYYCGEVLDWE